MKELQIGDRLKVTNAAGVVVVGEYCELFNGALGRIRLADGTIWPFAADAKVELTDEPLTPDPKQYPVTNAPWDTHTGPTRQEHGKPMLTPGLKLRPIMTIHPKKIDLRKCTSDQRKHYQDLAIDLHQAGRGVLEIAEQTGLSKDAIHRILQAQQPAANKPGPKPRYAVDDKVWFRHITDGKTPDIPRRGVVVATYPPMQIPGMPQGWLYLIASEEGGADLYGEGQMAADPGQMIQDYIIDTVLAGSITMDLLKRAIQDIYSRVFSPRKRRKA